MRDDLNKVMHERERYGSRNGYSEFRRAKDFNPRPGKECENLPFRESMRARYSDWSDCKESAFCSRNALIGAIRKAVGKSWDKFYSELCEKYDRRSVINDTIFDQIKRYVDIVDIVAVDGELFYRDYYKDLKPLSVSSNEFYVDPRDGILKHNAQYKTRKTAILERRQREEDERAKIFRQIDKHNVLRFIDGVWYHFEMLPIPKAMISVQPPWGACTGLFNVGHSYMKSSTRMKTWNEMNESERKRFGRKVVIGHRYDVFTKASVAMEGSLIISKSNGSAYVRADNRTYPNNMYHATKQTASHKMLKKAGII